MCGFVSVAEAYEHTRAQTCFLNTWMRQKALHRSSYYLPVDFLEKFCPLLLAGEYQMPQDCVGQRHP